MRNSFAVRCFCRDAAVSSPFRTTGAASCSIAIALQLESVVLVSHSRQVWLQHCSCVAIQRGGAGNIRQVLAVVTLHLRCSFRAQCRLRAANGDDRQHCLWRFESNAWRRRGRTATLDVQEATQVVYACSGMGITLHYRGWGRVFAAQ